MTDTSDPRGDEIVGGKNRPLIKSTKKRRSQLTKTRRARFLTHLAATCNVARSTRAAGVTVSAAYHLRYTDAEFARLWQQALATGYERLEAELLALALQGSEENALALAELEGGEPVETGPLDVKLALTLLERRRSEAAGRSQPGPARRRSTREETDAAILQKLDALEKRKKMVS